MVVGSLINPEAYASEYGKKNKFKPVLGTGVGINGGKTPIWLPYE